MTPLIITGLWGTRVQIAHPRLDGNLVGGMTSTPGLATIDSMTDSTRPSVVYATIYPVGMVLVIVYPGIAYLDSDEPNEFLLR